MNVHTKDTQTGLTPQAARTLLVEGNERFVKNFSIERDLKKQVEKTSQGQYPFAVVLGCIDSRVSAELVFDQGIGDIFSVRVAGNVVNQDVLGSMEYACKVAGSKLAVVMGHTCCGAVTAACKRADVGDNVNALLAKIKPAVSALNIHDDDMDESAIEKVTVQNIKLSIEKIRQESPILAEMENNKKIDIVGALYSVSTGHVRFL